MRKLLLLFTVLLLGITSFQLWMTKDKTDQKAEVEQAVSQEKALEPAPAESAPGGNFSLTDQNGKTVTDSDFRGKIMLVFFGFTHCPDECPLAVLHLSNAMQLLGSKASQVAPIFVSVDPKRDTPGVLKNFLANFDPRITGLTGTPEQIKDIATKYKVYFAKGDQKPGEDYSIDHSAYIYVMGKRGKYIMVLPNDATEQDIAHAVEPTLQ